MSGLAAQGEGGLGDLGRVGYKGIYVVARESSWPDDAPLPPSPPTFVVEVLTLRFGCAFRAGNDASGYANESARPVCILLYTLQ